jgi:hypothetical protein
VPVDIDFFEYLKATKDPIQKKGLIFVLAATILHEVLHLALRRKGKAYSPDNLAGLSGDPEAGKFSEKALSRRGRS